MSKMDGLRAMREARYAESQARAQTPSKTTGPTAATGPASAEASAAASRPKPAATLAVVPDLAEPDPAPALCGHRNMGGRTCTREAGHAAKSHRYS
jgi:hypothetical protein